MNNEVEVAPRLTSPFQDAKTPNFGAPGDEAEPLEAGFPAPEFGLGGVIVQSLTSVGAGFWLRNSYEWPIWAPFALALVWVPAFWWFVKHVRFDS